MKKKILGIILMSVGIFFLIGVVFGIVSLHIMLTILSFSILSLGYWGQWLILGGWSVLIGAGLGVYLISRGFKLVKQGQISESQGKDPTFI